MHSSTELRAVSTSPSSLCGARCLCDVAVCQGQIGVSGLVHIHLVWTFVVTALLELLWIIYRNFTFHRGFSRANIDIVCDAIRIKIRVPRLWNIRAGHHINIRLPGVGCRTLLESNPFRVVFWVVDTSPKPKLTTVHLLVEPRDGFIPRLLRYAKRSSERTRHLVLYSGLHWTSTSMKEYGTALLIVTGFGIAAILPHLKELLDRYGRCEVVTRRVHVVRQLEGEGM